MGVFWCWVVGVWCEWCVRGCGLVGECWCVWAGVRVLVVSDAHVSGLFLFLGFVFCFVSCLVNNGVAWLCGRGWVFACVVFGLVWACFGVGWWLVVFVLVCGRVGVCLSASCGLLGCCLCVGFV